MSDTERITEEQARHWGIEWKTDLALLNPELLGDGRADYNREELTFSLRLLAERQHILELLGEWVEGDESMGYSFIDGEWRCLRCNSE